MRRPNPDRGLAGTARRTGTGQRSRGGHWRDRTYAAEEVADVDGQDSRMSRVVDDGFVADILAVRVFDTQRAELLQALVAREFRLVVLSRMAICGFRFGHVAM